VVVLALLLVGGSGYYFFVVQAQAAVAAPAALEVINQPVGVDGNPGVLVQRDRGRRHDGDRGTPPGLGRTARAPKHLR
jgi:hypothetical protein